jgi:acetyl-CoA carboxylase carboxyl transferase subunit beta
MSILTWIEEKKRLKLLNAPKYVNPEFNSDEPDLLGDGAQKKVISERLRGRSSKGLWTRCDKCGVILYIKHLKENQRVCFGCTYHLQMSSQERIENLLDKESWRPFDETVSPCDPLEFHDQRDYTDRLRDAQDKTGLQDAIQTGTGLVDGIPVALGIMDFDFMGGSMGSVVGEKITRLIEYATQEGLTLLLVCASGGARMQEGVFSLMQMAKISSALQIYQSCANLLYMSILTSPTTGGVTASFAMLGDIIFAEPKALIAFAGRRVIEQTLCEDLPEDFQTSEYMLHHGLVDLIVPRRFLRQALSESIRLYKNAPFKKPGRIPFGIQNPISFLTEEKLRRRAELDLVPHKPAHPEVKPGKTKPERISKKSGVRVLTLLKVKDFKDFGAAFVKRNKRYVLGYKKYEQEESNSSENSAGDVNSTLVLTKTRDNTSDSKVVVKKNSDGFWFPSRTSQNAFPIKLKQDPLTFGQNPQGQGQIELLKEGDQLRYRKSSPNALSSPSNKTNDSGGSTSSGRMPGVRSSEDQSTISISPFPSVLVPSSSLFCSSLLEEQKQKQKQKREGEKDTISRQSVGYREILTSFQMMYQLFSKQIAASSKSLPKAKDRNTIDIAPVKEGDKDFGEQNVSEPAETGEVSPRFQRQAQSVSSEPLLLRTNPQVGTAITESANKTEGVQNRNGFGFSRKGGVSKPPGLASFVRAQSSSLGNSANFSLGALGANSSTDASLLQKFRELAEGVTQLPVPFQEGSSFGQPLEEESLDYSGNSIITKPKAYKVSSNHTVPSSLPLNKNRDFLNQALELAATESVEWRAFYVHQTISKTTGFLEDFLSPSQYTGLLGSNHKASTAPAQLQNTLFYKSICRTTIDQR